MADSKRSRRVSGDKTFSLKDRLFNTNTVADLAAGFKRADSRFPVKRFSDQVLGQFPDLELKACIECMADALVDYLPASYDDAAQTLLNALPPPLDPTLRDDDFGHFIWAVPSEFAARQGCSETHLATSLRLLHASTQRFSAEFAIRPFLQQFPKPVFEFLERCAVDDHYHVRRLASEGIRPYLPWGLKVTVPVAQVLGMLERLHGDPTRFVTRSVANTLNDLSRLNPDEVIATLESWSRLGKQDAAELDWMTRHALRGLVKNDHPGALSLLGYPVKPSFKLEGVKCPAVVRVGDTLDWQGRLKSGAAQKLKVLLRVHFLKANGSHGAKVFALKDVELAKNETLELSKRLPFKPMTTRALYPGEHHIELVVNGVARARKTFELRDG